MVRFAVTYARKRHPAAFPSKKDVSYTHYVKNINKLKLVYTSDQQTPAMFGAIDPASQQPVYIPVVWGLMSTFHIHVIDQNKVYRIIHLFTILEYIDDRLYVLEHSYHCERRKLDSEIENTDFDSVCSIEKMMESACSVDQSESSSKTMHTPSQSDSRIESDQSHCSKEDCSSEYNDNIQKNMYRKHFSLPQSWVKGDFSLLSYNVWNTNVYGDGDYMTRIKSLAKVCERSGADVIAFQEVRFEDGKGGPHGPNQLDHLSQLLPQYQFVYQPGQVQTHGIPDMIIEGVAIFSRYPIIYRHYLLLQRNPHDIADGHQRVLLHAQIDIPFAGPVHVLNTHLSLSHEARLTTVLQIWQYIQTLRGPVLLAGDMNAESHNEEVRFLAGKYSMYGKSTTNFHDIWDYHHSNHADNTTYQTKSNHHQNNPRGFTFNTHDQQLSKRIDLIFMREQPQIQLDDVMILDDGARGTQAASDHLGLFAKFSLKAQR